MSFSRIYVFVDLMMLRSLLNINSPKEKAKEIPKVAAKYKYQNFIFSLVPSAMKNAKAAIKTSVRSAAMKPADALAQTPLENSSTMASGSVRPRASVSWMN